MGKEYRFMARNKGGNQGNQGNEGGNRSRGGYSRMISERPAAAAAIASGVAAAVVGFLAFRRSGKSFSEFSSGAGTWIKDGLSDVRDRAGSWSEPKKDGLDSEERSQSEIAEEALTTKETGKKAKRPVDPAIEQELKTGAISY
jgi:hypothetical protein